MNENQETEEQKLPPNFGKSLLLWMAVMVVLLNVVYLITGESQFGYAIIHYAILFISIRIANKVYPFYIVKQEYYDEG